MDLSVVLVRPEDSTGVKLLFSIPDQAMKPLVFNSVALHPVREGGSITLKSLVGPRHLGDHGFVGSGSNLSLGPRWVNLNHFSLLANLGKEGHPWSEEEVSDVLRSPRPR